MGTKFSGSDAAPGIPLQNKALQKISLDFWSQKLVLRPALETTVAGLIFETNNREIFLERFFWREITAREQVSRAVILEKI